MIRRPPRSTRTDTLLPYTTLFRSTHGTRQDLYIEDIAGEIRRWCRNNKKHMIITMHPAVQQIVIAKAGTKAYYPMLKARQAAGGQAWLRKAMGWINLWRPPVYLYADNGMTYADNRSEESRVGIECVSTCITRGTPNH